MANDIVLYVPKKSYLNEATNYYCDLVLEGLGCINYKIAYSINDLNKCDLVFVLDAKSLILVKFRYPTKKVIVWYQGVVPEEALMMFNSKVKFYYWRLFEWISLNLSYFNFFVSSAMLEHYKKTYGFNKDNYQIIPCFNKELSEEKIYRNKKKYKEKTFVYAGSLHKWQCIDEMLVFFKNIQYLHPESKLLFLTFNVDEAKEIVDGYEIDNVEILRVSESEVEEYIAGCKYGFLIREDNTVNNVATPTKMSTYLSVGTIIIMTDVIHDFNSRISTKYSFCYTQSCSLERVIDDFSAEIDKEIDVDELVNEYKNIFDGYYNKRVYVDEIKEKFTRILNENN